MRHRPPVEIVHPAQNLFTNKVTDAFHAGSQILFEQGKALRQYTIQIGSVNK